MGILQIGGVPGQQILHRRRGPGGIRARLCRRYSVGIIRPCRMLCSSALSRQQTSHLITSTRMGTSTVGAALCLQ